MGDAVSLFDPSFNPIYCSFCVAFACDLVQLISNACDIHGHHDMKNSQTQLWLGLVFLRRLGERLARPRIMLVASEQN